MKVLLFGHSGFVGTRLYSFLKASGRNVKGASRKKLFPDDYCVDISRPETLMDIDFQPEVVINCASILPGNNLFDSSYAAGCFAVNAVGALNVVKWSEQNGVRKVVHCSTLSVVEKPWPLDMNEEYCSIPLGKHSVYGNSKLAGENLAISFCRQNNVALDILRLSSVYGPSMAWSGVMSRFIDQARSDREMTIQDGDDVFVNFIYIDDVVKIISAFLHEEEGGIYNVASEQEISLLMLASTIKEALNSKSNIMNVKSGLGGSARAKIDVKKLLNRLPGLGFTDLSDGIRCLIEEYML